MIALQYKREPEHTHCVSFWHIPGGTDYQHAEARVAWFYDAVTAEAFAAKHAMPPDMAFSLTAADYDKAAANVPKAQHD